MSNNIMTKKDIASMLRHAHDMIETGEPYYQAQEYAVQAQTDCVEMIEDVTSGKITDYKWVAGLLFSVSEMTRSSSEEETIRAHAQQVVDAMKSGALPGT